MARTKTTSYTPDGKFVLTTYPDGAQFVRRVADGSVVSVSAPLVGFEVRDDFLHCRFAHEDRCVLPAHGLRELEFVGDQRTAVRARFDSGKLVHLMPDGNVCTLLPDCSAYAFSMTNAATRFIATRTVDAARRCVVDAFHVGLYVERRDAPDEPRIVEHHPTGMSIEYMSSGTIVVVFPAEFTETSTSGDGAIVTVGPPNALPPHTRPLRAVFTANGSVDVAFADGTRRAYSTLSGSAYLETPNGIVVSVQANGTTRVRHANGSVTVHEANGRVHKAGVL